MTTQQIVMAVLVSLAVNEFLGFTDWEAKRIVRWAALRWETQTGCDHTAEWLEDLEHSPGRLFRLFSALWLLLGTLVHPDRLTLGLPSLWRISQPLRQVTVDAVDLFFRLIAAHFKSDLPSGVVVDRFCRVVLRAAVWTLPRNKRIRYLEEWAAELMMLPTRGERIRWAMSIAIVAPRLAILMFLRGFKSD